MDVVSREPRGFLKAVSKNTSASRGGLGQVMYIPQTSAATVEDVTPGNVYPGGGGQTVTPKTFSITKVRKAKFAWDGEESYAYNESMPGGVDTTSNDFISQCIRGLTAEMDTDVANIMAASAAYGSPGTVPFASGFEELVHARRLLIDRGSPVFDMHYVGDTMSGANAALLLDRSTVEQAGPDKIRRPFNFELHESASILPTTAGTGASATTDTTGYALGSTIVTLASAGTGTILAGDFISFAGDDEQYGVVTGNADVSAGGTVVIQDPGLRQAIPASAVAITVVGDSVRNFAFGRHAAILGVRQPARPKKDTALYVTEVYDESTDITFELANYLGYRMEYWEISAAWGVALIKPEHVIAIHGQ